MAVTIQTARGHEILPFIPDLARLRVTVFREFPYLYDGDTDYEKRYLAIYSRSPHCFVVLVFVDATIVGASTALPLRDETENLQAPFVTHQIDVSKVFYFGESVLLKPYRGQGFGKEFFNFRESEAKRQGFSQAAFCAVKRPDNHPARPRDYRSLDNFWQRQGFVKRPELTAQMSWKDLGDGNESVKSMVFWTKNLENR